MLRNDLASIYVLYNISIYIKKYINAGVVGTFMVGIKTREIILLNPYDVCLILVHIIVGSV